MMLIDVHREIFTAEAQRTQKITLLMKNKSMRNTNYCSSINSNFNAKTQRTQSRLIVFEMDFFANFASLR
jgi:hypothetical protein